MKPVEIAFALKNLEAPNTTLDRELAIFVGYSPRSDGSSWLSPSNQVVPLPAFTASTDAAYALAVELIGQDFCGCSWEAGLASAKIKDFPYASAKTPAIAILLATFLAKHFADKSAPAGHLATPHPSLK